MKQLSTSAAALLGLSFIGAVLLILSQTSLVKDPTMLASAGLVVLVSAAFRLVDVADRNSGKGHEE